MNIKNWAAGTVAMSLIAASGWVQAQPQLAVTARPVNLRAGPATDYPIVAVLPAGFALSVQGCLPEYTWCDVVAGQSRGWMWAGNINYYYQNSYVPLINYGPVLGIGALSFFLGDYWGSHYRDRPFYRERHRWEGRRYAEPRYTPPQPGYGPRGDRFGPRGDRYVPGGPQPDNGRRGDRYAPGGAVVPDRRAAPSAAQPGTPPLTRQEQRDLNQGGSSSVDPRLRPQY